MRAKDVMTTKPITVSPDASVREIAATLLQNRISAVPVVDGENRLLGIVSEGDFLRRVELGTSERGRSWWLRLVADPSDLAAEYVKSHALRAKDIMTSPVVTIEENTSLDQIATLLEQKRIKRVAVVRGGRLVGIVSRANLIQGLAATSAKPSVTTADDATIRAKLMAILDKEAWASPATTNVTVVDGVVQFWGLVGSEKERQASRVAAEAIAGVKKVVDNRGLRIDIPAGV